MHVMRLAAFILLALGLSAGVASGAALAPGGSFEVKGGRGTVQISGKGVLVGRLGKGSLEIVDLSPNDQWSPRVNGIPRGKHGVDRGCAARTSRSTFPAAATRSPRAAAISRSPRAARAP